MKPISLAVIAVVASCLAAAQAAAVQPLAVNTGVGVYARVSGGTVVYQASDGQTSATVPTTPQSSSVTQSDSSSFGSATATASTSSLFTSVNTGSVMLGPLSTTATLFPTGNPFANASANAYAALNYLFTVDSLSSLSVNYIVAEAASSPFDYSVELVGFNQGVAFLALDFENLAGTGSATGTFTPGRYELRISGSGMVQQKTGGVQTATSQGANFTFSIADVGAVPEVTSWWTMIAGFGAVGLVMRRRQRVSAAVTLT